MIGKSDDGLGAHWSSTERTRSQISHVGFMASSSKGSSVELTPKPTEVCLQMCS